MKRKETARRLAVVLMLCSLLFTYGCNFLSGILPGKETEASATDDATEDASSVQDSSSEDESSDEPTDEPTEDTSDEPSSETTTPAPFEDPFAGREPAPERTATEWDGVVISRVYGNGGNADAPIEHGFIELKNVTETEIPLDGASLYYRDETLGTVSLALDGVTLPAGESYLIRCRAAENYDERARIYRIDDCDKTWDLTLANKEYGVVLAASGGTENIEKLTPISYFFASDAYAFDTGYLSDPSKNKMAVRTADAVDSGYYFVNLTKANFAKLEAVAPRSGNSVNLPIRSCLDEVTFSAKAGYYTDAFSLALTANEGYRIYYTTDGSDPSVSETRREYVSPIALSDTSEMGYGALTEYAAQKMGQAVLPETDDLPGAYVIKAYATDGERETAVYTNTYFISRDMGETGVSVVSLSMDKEVFCGDNGFYNHFNLADQPNVRGLAMMEVFDENGQRRGYSNVEIAVSGHHSTGRLMRSMRVYYKKANNQDGGTESDLFYDLFGGYAKNEKGQSITDFSRLVLRNAGNDSRRAYMRDAYIQRVSADRLTIDTMAYAPVLVFINGEFWGVYNARERYSGEYLESHYGVDEDNVSLAEYGDGAMKFVISSGDEADAKDLNDLFNYMRLHDPKKPEVYNYIASKLDVSSLIDLYVSHLYFNARDWPANNTKLWRNRDASDPSGVDTKWHFMMLDMDMGLSMYPPDDVNNTTANANFFSWCRQTDCAVGVMMSRMLRNDNFKNCFIARFYEAATEIFDPDELIAEFELLLNERAPLFPLIVDRWQQDGASVTPFNEAVANIPVFLRERPAYAVRYLCEYFGITESAIPKKKES